MITTKHLHPLERTVAENLWNEGHQSHLGPNSIGAVPPLHPTLHAWVAFVDNTPAGIWACRFDPSNKRVRGLLSYVRPEFRNRGVYRTLQAAYDPALAAAGYTEIWSDVVEGPGAEGMRAAIEAKGGVVAQYVYRRPLTQA